MNVVYLSYTGLLEPLGQSQVLAYLRILARQHAITLITFEKPEDFTDGAAVEALRADCGRAGIRWLPQRYHRKPRLLATLWDLTVFTATALREARRTRADLVHARSYIPTFVALVVKTLTGVPFIFDMRAFWPDEMAAAGRVKPGGPMFRLIKWVERVCLTQAAAVVSLTEAGVAHMREVYGRKVEDVRFAVIPTCVDLERFQPAARTAGELKVVGSVGSVLSGWFRFGWLMAFFQALSAMEPDVAMRIVTREDEAAIRRRAAEAGIPAQRLEVYGVTPSAVPNAIADLSAAAMFFETGVAKLGSCPTRMGEILATGLPVVANPGVGDVGEIIRRYRVGVLVEESSASAMRRAVEELRALLADPELPARCREAAEAWFSLDRGAARYGEIYQAVGAAPVRVNVGAEGKA